MTETSKKIIKNIKECHICPKPRWIFTVKNSLFWFMFAFSLLVGALSFAVIMDVLVSHDWDIYLRLHKTFLQFLLLSLPYLWILCLIVFSGIAYFEFVHTKGWYNHRVYMVVSASIISSLGLGVIFFFSGIGKKIDHALDNRMPLYGILNMDKKRLWCHPGDGLLGGEVIEMKGMPVPPPMPMQPEMLVIKDCHGNAWTVDRFDPRAKMPQKVIIGQRIKVVGREIDGQRFEAEEFRSW